ncbi:MAG: hypothetical protein AAFO69_07390 [Bacteroidota bacterium]
MKAIHLFIIVLLLSFACADKKSTSEQSTDKSAEVSKQTTGSSTTVELTLAWQTDTLLTTCEAALYDADSELIYVANINQNPWGEDGNGFISTLATDGTIKELKWVTGLDGPKGMGIANGKLYVADIDELVEIDIAQQKISNRYVAGDSVRLNDVTVDADGNVYASGTQSGKVYQLRDGTITAHSEEAYGGLNGLLYQEEGIYFANFPKATFGIYRPGSPKFDILTTAIGQGDGIIRLKNGDFITSSWGGELYYIQQSDWSQRRILDTKAQKIGAADLGYIPDQDLVIVPTFFHNRVMAYKVSVKQ